MFPMMRTDSNTHTHTPAHSSWFLWWLFCNLHPDYLKFQKKNKPLTSKKTWSIVKWSVNVRARARLHVFYSIMFMCSEKTQIRSQSYDRAYFANDATEMRSVCAEWRWSDAYFNPTITADSLCRPHGASCGQHQLNNMLTTLPVIVLSFQIFVSWIHFQHETSCVCCNQILRQWLKIRRKKRFVLKSVGCWRFVCARRQSVCCIYTA